MSPETAMNIIMISTLFGVIFMGVDMDFITNIFKRKKKNTTDPPQK